MIHILELLDKVYNGLWLLCCALIFLIAKVSKSDTFIGE